MRISAWSSDVCSSDLRLFTMSEPIPGTVVETYLRQRGIAALHETGSLRFHPRCYYRRDEHSPTASWPAMIASVTDLGGRIRSEGRRVGKECVRTCRFRWSPCH